MTAPTIEMDTRGKAPRATPRRHAGAANALVFDAAARLMLSGVLAALAFTGLTGLATQLAAVAPPPCAGPAPGLP